MGRTGYWFLGAILALAFLPAPAHADVGTVWMQRYAQPGYCNDEATAMCVDAAGRANPEVRYPRPEIRTA
jgi:hypothetical protein